MTKSSKDFCRLCTKGVNRVRGECTTCRKPDRVLDHNQVCKWCRRYSHRHCIECGRHATEVRTIARTTQLCDRCTLRQALNQVIPDQPAGLLAPLRPVILAAEPLTTRRWLSRHTNLLTSLDQGFISLDHATLDTLPHPKAVEHLRALLISTDILPPDPTGIIRRLENSLDSLLAGLDHGHHRTVTRWIHWKVLPPLRQRATDGLAMENAAANSRRRIEHTVAFLPPLQGNGGTLANTTQHDIDTWFGRPGAGLWNARPFLAWAQERKHLPGHLELPASYIGTRTPPGDAEERWTAATMLLTDDTLDPADRVAGLLVVLYAQRLSRIATLTRDDITIANDTVQLRLGPDPLDLPDPLATLIQALPVKRRDGTAENLPNPWLFAGGLAGTHINPTNLGQRLRRIGIQPRRMRLAAAEQLSREVPPAMLSGILGLRTATIVKQTSQSGGNWATYAATRKP